MRLSCEQGHALTSRHWARAAATCAAIACAAPAWSQVNAPVAPDTIYVGRVSPSVGLSVIDLNGFGQSTGNPTYDPLQMIEGNSNFPNNPNFKLQGLSLFPQLFAGTTTLDGGSAGVFTLTRSAALDDLVLKSPDIAAIGDMMLGHPLDTTFNNGLEPTGCLSQGGNLCAITAKKLVSVGQGGQHTLAPSSGGTVFNVVPGGGNPISFAPHPNPPALSNPPLCGNPFMGSQEPTSIYSLSVGFTNLLVPGDPFGDPSANFPPSGLLSSEQNAFFVAPSQPLIPLPACFDYQIRQHIGHYLYSIDRVRGEVVVLNSNTFAVLDRIALTDPTELAMGTNLDFLAVSNQSTNTVSIIGIDPHAASFHQVIANVPVGAGPRGIAWDPGNEDVLVCNEGDNSLSIISTVTHQVRKLVKGGLKQPFAVAITQRQFNFGFQRNVYFAYVLDRAGRVTLFESGPAGVNGWGYDDFIGQTKFRFNHPQAIQPDPLRLSSGVWIAHDGQLDAQGQPTALVGGAVTNLVLESPSTGQIPLPFMHLNRPHMRSLSFKIAASIGSDQLTGSPVDIAFDDQRNLGALENYSSVFGAGAPARLNGKSLVRAVPGGAVVNTNTATYMFLPIRNSAGGGVDVIELATGLRFDTNAFHAGVQSIPAAGAAVVMDYFRQ